MSPSTPRQSDALLFLCLSFLNRLSVVRFLLLSFVLSSCCANTLDLPCSTHVDVPSSGHLRAPLVSCLSVASTMSSPAKTTPAQVTGPSGSRTVTLGGRTLAIRPQARVDADLVSSGIIHKKEERKKLDEAKRTELLNAATKARPPKFAYLSLTLEDPDKLEATYDLGMMVDRMRASHTEYDMHDVMTLVVCDDAANSNPTEQINLYENYATVTAEQAALSNQFYHRWAAEETIRENLAMTYKYFHNNVEPDLFGKVIETYRSYPVDQQGGPLFFVLMMNQLLSNTESAALHLQKRLKDLSLATIPGENVSKAVSLARGAIDRLQSISKVPDDVVMILLRIFQTSSVDEFNNVFKLLETQRALPGVLNNAALGLVAIQPADVFRVAEQQYRVLQEAGDWTGVSTKANSSVFTASGSSGSASTGIVCWNCGGSHHLRDCKKPLDRERVKKSKAQFARQARAAKSGSNTGNASTDTKSGSSPPGQGRWRKPEPHENNRRVINGKEHEYDTVRRRWNKVRANTASVPPPATAPAQPATQPAAVVPAASSTPIAATAAVPPASATQSTDAKRRAAFANAVKSINNMAAFL